MDNEIIDLNGEVYWVQYFYDDLNGFYILCVCKDVNDIVVLIILDSVDVYLFVVFNNQFYFLGYSSVIGQELFKYDGISIIFVQEFVVGIVGFNLERFWVYGNSLYFNFYDQVGNFMMGEYDGIIFYIDIMEYVYYEIYVNDIFYLVIGLWIGIVFCIWYGY